MEIEIGRVTHYFDHLGVAVLALTASLKLGDKVHILGHSTELYQRVGSLEVGHHPVEWVKPGDDVALKVMGAVHPHDRVYRVVEEVYEPHPV
jgi:putative protease